MTISTPGTRFTRRSALLGGLAVVVTACGSGGSDTIQLSDGGLAVPTPENTEVEASGDSAEFAYETLDGASARLSDLPAGPVVVNFFASWCPTCIAEMPDFETVSQNMAGQVTFLGLAMNDRTENAVQLVADTGVTYPVGNDQNGEIFQQFGGLGMPTTVFVSADRTVANVHTGVLNVESLSEIITTELLS